MTLLLARALADALLPQRCPGCGEPAEAAKLLCDGCAARVPRLRVALCARCLAGGGDGAACARHRAFTVYAPWLFDERAAAVVHALKYHDRPALAAPLGAELAAALPRAWRRPDLVLEVPLHAARERERGYNQSAALAGALADALGAPRLPGALRRVRPTPPQARLRARPRGYEPRGRLRRPKAGVAARAARAAGGRRDHHRGHARRRAGGAA